MNHVIYSEKELAKIAQILTQNAKSKTLCFYGEMGAGKTTLIKAIVKELGGADKGSSPTFGIVNQYEYTAGGLLGYHFDFYRLNDEIEAYDMGLEEYFNEKSWVFIEWPEKIGSLLPPDATTIKIEIVDRSTRKLSLAN